MENTTLTRWFPGSINNSNSEGSLTSNPNMDESSNSSSPKSLKSTTSSHSSSGLSNSTTKRRIRSGQPQPFKLHTEHRGKVKEQAFERRVQEQVAEESKHRIRIAQGLPLTTEKPQNLPKPPVKQQTKPVKIKLHSDQRATRRAGFNDLVASKISTLEILRKFEDKLQKVIEEEEIKILRKEMVPKAQLMPFFDRPFFPQRSNRPLTVPREPSFLNRKCWIGEPYKNYQDFNHNFKAIK